MSYSTNLPPTILRYNAAVQSSNEGVGLLESGSYVLATRLFRQSLVSMKALLLEETPPPTINEKPSLETTAPTEESPLRKSDRDIPGLVEKSPSYFCYKQPILLRETLPTTPVHEVMSKATLGCAAILTNMSLAQHAAGLQSGRSAVLVRACQCYSMGLAVLRATPTESSGSLLEVLVLNNRSLVHEELGEFAESLECLETAANLVPGINPSDLQLSGSEMEQLLLNIALRSHPSTAKAA